MSALSEQSVSSHSNRSRRAVREQSAKLLSQRTALKPLVPCPPLYNAVLVRIIQTARKSLRIERTRTALQKGVLGTLAFARQ